MPKAVSKQRLNVIAIEYLVNGGNCVNALVKAGYKLSYAQNRYKDIFSKVELKDEIERLKAKRELKTDITREKQLLRLDNVYDLSMKKNKLNCAVAAVREQNEMLGYHTDNAPNIERERLLKARRQAERGKLTTLQAVVVRRTEQIGSGDILDSEAIEGDIQENNDEVC